MEFRILGALEVVADGEVLELGGPRQRAVLALLLLRPNTEVPRAQLLDAVWGDDPPRTAIGSLQVYVHGLRQAIGATRIETIGSAYRLHIEQDELDVARFDDAVERARAALASGDASGALDTLSAGLALWRGAPLADLAEHGEAEAAARELEERRLVALELQNDLWLALGRTDLVLGSVERQIAANPYRERLRAQLILALYRAGRQSDALAAYQAMRSTWDDDLGIEPTPALKELERAVLQHDPALDAPEPPQRKRYRPPVPATPLVGRRLEIAAVTALFGKTIERSA